MTMFGQEERRFGPPIGAVDWDGAAEKHVKTSKDGAEPNNEIGTKQDAEKPRWDLLPLETLDDVVKVLTFGVKKYSPDNWKRVPDAKNRYFSAMMRHISAWQQGEHLDPESNLPHLAHAGCCLIFLIWFSKYERHDNAD